MSTLTKIFVVVQLLLVLFASVVMIQHVARTEDWKALAEDQTRQRVSAEAQAANSALALQRVEKQYEAEKLKTLDLIKQHTSEIDTKRGEINRLSRALTASQNTTKVNNATLSALQKSVDKEIELREEMRVELARLHKQSIRDGDQIRGLQGLLKDKDATIENLTRSVSVLQVQAAQAAAEAKDLRERLKGIIGVGTPTVASVVTTGPKIEGTVTAVKANIASLNVGAADGVKKNMEFIIYRGADFVARLKVADVYPSTCAGIITSARRRDVRKGDKASTSLLD